MEKLYFSVYDVMFCGMSEKKHLSFSISVLLFILITFQLISCEYKLEEVHPKGYYLRLEDGSIWEIDWWNSWSTYKWHKGDYISVYPDGTHLENLNADPYYQTVKAQACPSRETIPYRRFITEILDGGSELKLDNGFIWKGHYLTVYSPKKVNWQVGDEVALSFMHAGRDGETMSYTLRNLRTFEEVFASYWNTDEWTNYQIVDHVEENGEIFYLTDGSRFKSHIHSASGWLPGDRVMVYPYNGLGRFKSFVIFNQDYVDRGFLGRLSRYEVTQAWKEN